MSTYKVIQDIEAEDHILGPLTLRQFIYGLVAAFCLYISFLCIAKGAAFLIIVFLPPGLLAAFFAFPFRQDQPTEIWALAKVRFLFKPRTRIWNQSGVKQLVTITVPKKIERQLTDGLSQIEVRSRLRALADTIDSRGWAVKNVNVNLYSQPNLLASEPDSERLIDVNNIPQEVPNYDVQAADDILDEQSNPVAQQFDQLINASSQAHRQQLLQQMSASTPAVPPPTASQGNWFMKSTAINSRQPILASSPTVTSSDEATLSAELKARTQGIPAADSNLRTLRPASQQPAAVTTTDTPAQPPAAVQAPQKSTSTTSPAPLDPAILNLASNNDLNVATIAREAHKAKSDESGDGEVVISLR